MNIIRVNDKEVLDELYQDSALTIVGLCEESISDLISWIKKYTDMSSETVYIIKGILMNTEYSLTGDNRYQDDLTLACVKLSDMRNPMAVAIPRFSIGGRWFDDIVDNNARREEI